HPASRAVIDRLRDFTRVGKPSGNASSSDLKSLNDGASAELRVGEGDRGHEKSPSWEKRRPGRRVWTPTTRDSAARARERRIHASRAAACYSMKQPPGGRAAPA